MRTYHYPSDVTRPLMGLILTRACRGDDVMKRLWVAAFRAAALLWAAGATAADRPNVVWIVGEDMGPELGCYGDPNAVTPNIDRLARQGVRFTKAFTHAPVCAPSR